MGTGYERVAGNEPIVAAADVRLVATAGPVSQLDCCIMIAKRGGTEPYLPQPYATIIAYSHLLKVDKLMNAAQSRSRKRALVIAGAGAALELGAPSTSDLTKLVREWSSTDQIMRRFGCDQALKKIDEELSVYLDGPASVSFEHIFHCAQEVLASAFEPIPGAVNAFRPVLYPFMKSWEASEKSALRELAACRT